MRIQHNIMAMGAYRNYTNNVNAMKKNLEKLSSGYKINRAGDDAAGLAISEKMRAQITGLETAQKNAKDGISLVQTAEGALTEVHDMLNRMVTLATQSANGTYDDENDRVQLQKELDALRTEINRIADSSNFNGIKLLDGSLDTAASKILGSDRILSEVWSKTDGSAVNFTGIKTVLDGGPAQGETPTEFTVDFTGLTIKAAKGDSSSSAASNKGTIDSAEGSVASNLVGATGTGSGSTAADSVKTDGGTTDDVFTAGSKLSEALEGATGFQLVDLSTAKAVKVQYASGKWTISVSDGTNTASVDAASAALDADGKTLVLKDADGGELLKIAANTATNVTTSNALTDADFQTAYSAAKNTGITYGVTGGVNIGSNCKAATFEVGADFVEAATNAGFGAGNIKVQFNSGNWEITDNGGTNKLENLTASSANGVLTLKDANGKELLKINSGDTAITGAGTFETAFATAQATGVNYTAAVGADPVTIGTNAGNATYTVGAGLAELLDAEEATTDSISVQYNNTDNKWEITAGGATITGKAAVSGGVLTLTDPDGKELLKIKTNADDADTLTEADFQAQYTASAQKTGLTYTAPAAAGAGAGAGAGGANNTPASGDVRVSINGTTLADITVDEGDDAKKIADKVLAELTAKGTDVTIDGNKYTFAASGNGLKFTLADPVTEDNMAANYSWDVKVTDGGIKFGGNHTAGTVVSKAGQMSNDGAVANTVFRIDKSDLVDGAKITIDGKSVTLAVGKNSKFNDGNAVDLTDLDKIDLDVALSRISDKMGDTTNFIIGVNNSTNGDLSSGITVHKKDSSTETYDTKEKLANVFSMEKPGSSGLTLQIGDTADSYNKLNVSVRNMHTSAMGIGNISIADQDSAASAVDAIKAAINYVSDARGTLGATQNRLDHTINNLSVMTENIQDAESTIRDTDVAAEMMEYTKNNILIQSAQAMLAQANQVPQGVLQLLQ